METRVSKYREYRNSIIKQDSFSNESIDLNEKEFRSTGVLSIDDVMKAVDDTDKYDEIAKKRNKYKILKLTLISVLILAIIAGLVILGIFAWR